MILQGFFPQENTMYRYKTIIGRRDGESNLRWTTS